MSAPAKIIVLLFLREKCFENFEVFLEADLSNFSTNKKEIRSLSSQKNKRVTAGFTANTDVQENRFGLG